MESLNRKIRTDDVLGNLPQEQKDRIIQWLGSHTYTDVLNKIAAPPPEGLGLQVQYNSLRRFYTKNLPDELLQKRQEEIERFRGYAELIEAEPAPYEALTKECLQKHLFYQSLSPDFHGSNFLKYMQLMLQWRSLELKEKYFELEKSRFESKSSAGGHEVKIHSIEAFEARLGSLVTKVFPAPPNPNTLDSHPAPLLSAPPTAPIPNLPTPLTTPLPTDEQSKIVNNTL